MEFIYLVIIIIIVLIFIGILLRIFYKNGIKKGRYEQVFIEKHNYQIQVKSNYPEVDQKYKYYNWDINISQSILIGDQILFDSDNMREGLQKDYGTIVFKVISRKLIEKNYKGNIHLIVEPIYEK